MSCRPLKSKMKSVNELKNWLSPGSRETLPAKITFLPRRKSQATAPKSPFTSFPEPPAVLSNSPEDNKFAFEMIIWDAIQAMRQLSDEGKAFSFSFMSCDRTKERSEGIIEVLNGRLLSRERADKYADAEIIERYINLDTMEVRRFYQPLLMTFNGENVQMI